MGTAGEAVAIDADEHLRLELGEAVDDALGSEIGSAHAPHGPEAGRREHRDDRFGDIRQVAGDPVAWLHADICECGGQGTDLTSQFLMCDCPRLAGLIQIQNGRIGVVGRG